MTIPNVWFRPFGKLLFCAIDILIGWMTHDILTMRGFTSKSAAIHTALFLLSPITTNVSTRGNADSIVCALVVAAVYLLIRKRARLAAVCFGLAVHMKIYPIIYALPLVLFLDKDYEPADFADESSSVAVKDGRNSSAGFLARYVIAPLTSVYQWCRAFLTWRRVEFGLVSGSVCLLLTALFYHVYGFTFLYETYLYHAVRTDNRHNFSPYFYDLYLRYDRPSRAGAGLMSFLPQFGTVLLLGALYCKDLPFTLFAQTLAFVAFNKVCTAQYFHWYMCILPLMTPQTRMGWQMAVGLLVLWFATELHWNYWSYWLEIQGQSTFLWVWVAGLLFFAANIIVLVIVLLQHTYRPVFENGRLAMMRDGGKAKRQ